MNKREYDLKRNLPRKLENQKKRDEIEKEIIETKIYLKKVWGENIKMPKMSCREIRKLGDELGINVYGRKFFPPTHDENKIKIITHVCRRCNNVYEIEKPIGTYSKGGRLCSECWGKIKIN